MMSITSEPRAAGPGTDDRPSRGGTPRASGAEGGHREEGLKALTAIAGEVIAVPAMLLGAIALYVALIAPPLLTLLPVALVGLLAHAIGSLWGALS